MTSQDAEADERKLVVEWDNRNIPKDRGMTWFVVIFTMGLTSMMAFITYSMIQGTWAFPSDSPLDVALNCLLLFVGYGAFLVIAASWLRRYSAERIAIDDERFTYESRGILRTSKADIAINDLREVRYGRRSSDGEDS